MKKLLFFSYAVVCITGISCMRNIRDIDITYNDSGQYYSMNADFGKSKTRAVEEYMDKRIGTASNMSFTNTSSDATLTLNDRTTFYMKKYPGHLEIKLDKDENSVEAYYKIKEMCEGIKKILVK